MHLLDGYLAIPGAAMPPRGRQRWEYKVEPIFNPSRSEANLNYLATEGWRLVAIGDASNFQDQQSGVFAKGPLLILERECFPDGEEGSDGTE